MYTTRQLCYTLVITNEDRSGTDTLGPNSPKTQTMHVRF